MQLRILVAISLAALTGAWMPPRFVSSKWPSCGQTWAGQIAASVFAAAKLGGGGTALVIGANTGPGPGGTDPMFKWLASAEAASALDNTFFIEPVPVVFRVLQHNLRQLPRAQGLNVAIANQSGTLNMYCVGLAERVSETQNGGLQLSISDEAARLGVPGWAMETCSLTRGRLFSAKDFARSGQFGGFRALRNRSAYDALITEHPVQVITFAELQQRYVRSRVLYLQVDAEGKDDEVVQLALEALPPAALPLAITFEILLVSNENLARLMAALTSRGYRLCYDHKNLVARLREVRD